MSETTPQTRKLLAGVAAVVLTLSAAGAAVAVNLGTGAPVETPAGQLSATEPISTAEATQATPSTIYVDVTVPVTQPAEAGVPAPGAPATTEPAAVQAPASYSDDDSHESDDDGRHGDDHEESEHEEGADDDD